MDPSTPLASGDEVTKLAITNNPELATAEAVVLQSKYGVRAAEVENAVDEGRDTVDLWGSGVPTRDFLYVEDCARAGVAGLVIVSSGFAESGEQGRALQRHIVQQARGSGMRIIGPNAMGIVNTDPSIRLNASLAPDLPARDYDVHDRKQAKAAILRKLNRERP